MASEAVYRAPMRARTVDADRFAGAALAVERGFVAMGEGLPIDPEDIEEALELTATTHGPKAARMLRRFADLPDCSLLWTQTAEREYRLGRVAGPWRWERSAPARALGIQNVRDARWLPRGFEPDEVPAAVAATFARGGRNLQRTRDSGAETESARLWCLSA